MLAGHEKRIGAEKMTENKLVYVVGDIHGAFGKLNAFINRHIRLDAKTRALSEVCEAGGRPLEIVILQCGDFGFFWPG